MTRPFFRYSQAGKDGLKGEDPPARLKEDDVRAYIDKLFAQRESKTHT